MNTQRAWIAVAERLPGDGIEVETCVSALTPALSSGEREAVPVVNLVLLRTLWWKPDQSVMAVGIPTHWRPCAPAVESLGAFEPLKRLLAVPENGTVVVAGAYKGDYLHYFSERFPTAKLFGFEPQREAYQQAKARLGVKAMLFNQGLGTATRTVLGGRYGSDGCSVCVTAGDQQLLQMLDVARALNRIGGEIDLLVLNCEGSEWALLPYMMDEMMHHKIAAMAVQFHPEYVSSERAARVLALVDEYYDRAHFDYPAWCYFTRKGI